MIPRRAAVIGAGPAGLMAAHELAKAGVHVSVYERMASPARKFLMAGRGGLNLTHSEPLVDFLHRYGSRREDLRGLIEAFSPDDLQRWCRELEISLFTGSSGRVFPAGLKASPLLRAWLRELNRLGVEFYMRHRFAGWDGAGRVRILRDDGGELLLQGGALVLALGGASWPKLGSDGGWVEMLRARGIDVTALAPANCGFDVQWSALMREKHAGAPLKNIRVSFAGHAQLGECVITRNGLEGGVIYALSSHVRDAIARDSRAEISVDLRPGVEAGALAESLARQKGKDTLANRLRKAAGLSGAAAAVLRESGALSQEPLALARAIKDCRITVLRAASIEKAISSAGGVRFEELDAHLMMKKMPGVFCAGEMLDWEAPTGGYLLQACFASGRAAGIGAARWLAVQGDASLR